MHRRLASTFVLAAVIAVFPVAAQEQQPHAVPAPPPAAAGEHGAAAPAAPAEGHGESAGHGEGAGHGDPLAKWKWINFGILAALIGYALAKNAGPFFAGRIAEIQKEITEARAIKAEADARAGAIEKRLANLETELAMLRSDAKREMDAEGVRIQEETRKAAAKAEEQIQQEIASASKAAENSLRAETSRLALELAEKKLKARMSPEAEGSLVGRFIAGLNNISSGQSKN